MNLTYKTIIFALGIALLPACDTTEDEYIAGDEPTDVLSVEGEIFLNADGTAQTLEVTSISYWDVTIDQTGNNFSFTTSTDHGNGTITVSSGTNYQGSIREAKLIVSARNFSKTVEIDLYQAALQFDMTPESSYPVASESGGDVTLTFTSTVEWTFTVQPNSADTNDKGSLSWLTFTPSLPGEGNRRQISAIATWSPNYTEEERVITLALEATNESVMDRIDTDKLPPEFTLRQEAGTAPKNLIITSYDVTFTSATVSIGYNSVSAVKDCGVLLRESGEDISTARTISASQSSYPTSGPVTMTITGLQEGKIYIAVPYVENMVRTETATDVSTEFTILQHGASVTLSEVNPSERKAEASFSVSSDMDLSSATLIISDTEGNSICQETLSLSGIFGANDVVTRNSYTISTEDDALVPKTEYSAQIILTSAAGEVVAQSEMVSFQTTGYVPSEDFNNPPE